MEKKNLTGMRFGNLVVISEAPSRIDKSGRKRTMWYCNCDCGNKGVVAATNNLTMGKTVRCGNKCKLRIKPNQYAAKNTVYLNYKNNARKRDIPFLLNRQDIFEIIEKPCFYCGTEKSNTINTDTYSYNYNGIDRINSQKPYNKENIIPCCKNCNRAKSDLKQSEFYDWVKRINENFTYDKVIRIENK